MKKTIYNLIAIPLTLFSVNGCSNFEQYTPSTSRAQQGVEFDRLQTLLDLAVNQYKLPGIQAGYLQSGKGPVLSSSGNVDLLHKKDPINNTHSFRIGSTTKMFLAALLCRYVEQKKINYDETLDKWFPKFPQAENITIKSLLNQTSGIPETLFSYPWMMFISVVHPSKIWNPNDVITKISRTIKVQEAEEDKFFYSNTNYLLLGLVLEAVTQKPLALQLEQEFFKPLGMMNTKLLVGEPKPDSTFDLVPGYDEYIPFGPHLISATQSSWDSLTFSAGAMSSNVSDLLIWLDAFFNQRVVSAESLKLMRTWVDSSQNGRDDSIVGYGLGLTLYNLEGTILEGHPGGGFGGECFPFWDSKTNTSYVVMYNLSRKDNPAGKKVLHSMLSLPIAY